MSNEEHGFDLAEISYGGQGFEVRLHAALGFFITLLVTLLGVKYQQEDVSPFEANPTDMLVFMGFLSLYAAGLMAMAMMRSTGTKVRRGLALAVALLLWHLSFIAGLFASASLLFLLVPAFFWWILMASSSLLLLIAAPCKPMELFYSKIQHQSSPQAQVFNRSEEPDANTPDLEKKISTPYLTSTAPTSKVIPQQMPNSVQIQFQRWLLP